MRSCIPDKIVGRSTTSLLQWQAQGTWLLTCSVKSNHSWVQPLIFASPFDRASHNFFYYILQQDGLHKDAITLIKGIYENAYSHCQINEHITAAFPIKRSVRQGSPTSTMLYLLVTKYVINRLDEGLQGLHKCIGHRKTSCRGECGWCNRHVNISERRKFSVLCNSKD